MRLCKVLVQHFSLEARLAIATCREHSLSEFVSWVAPGEAGNMTDRILTVSNGCVAVTAPQAERPPAMKALMIECISEGPFCVGQGEDWDSLNTPMLLTLLLATVAICLFRLLFHPPGAIVRYPSLP